MDELTNLLKKHECKFNSVLDVGCGIDYLSLATLASLYKDKEIFECQNFIGIDNKIKGISREYIIYQFMSAASFSYNHLLVEKQLSFCYADLNSNDSLPKEKFDLIILSNVLHLLSKTRAQQLIDYFIKKLNKGGYMFIKIANEHNLNQEGPKTSNGPRWGLTEGELKEWIKRDYVVHENDDANRQILFN